MSTEQSTLTSGKDREEYLNMIDYLLKIPHKILKHHGVGGLSQLVLHDLSHDHGFKLNRAIYLADNPDFDHLVGVAGYAKNECHLHDIDHWENPAHFFERMSGGFYHSSCAGLSKKSLKKLGADFHDRQVVGDLGEAVGIENPLFLTWEMKHGNHGILLFEPAESFDIWKHNLLAQAVALLSLCPV